ncbi:MAG: hypothetical protein Q8N53_08690 [Longimicrobiales bacterium]|nr:hypothetical protein [Longimicrobiales bacterium]
MKPNKTPKWIFSLQVASVSMIWVFVLSISFWILHLLRLSRELHDVPSGSLGISLVAIPVFMIGASVLTYVFVGLQRGREPPGGSQGSGEGDGEETST